MAEQLQPVVEVPKTDPLSQAMLQAKKDAREGKTTPPPAPTEPPATAPPAVTTPPPAAFDEAAYLKEKTGGRYDTMDALLAAVNKPPEVKVEQIQVQPTFENEESRQVYEAIATGKYDQVLPFVQAKVIATKVTSLPKDQLIKDYFKDQYKLTDAEAEKEYNRRYIPKAEVVGEEYLDIETKKAATLLESDSAQAAQYFAKKAESVKLPFTQQQPDPPKLTVEQQQLMDFGKSYATAPLSKLPFEINDPQKGITVKGTAPIPEDKIANIKSKIAAAPQAFLAGLLNRWYTADGQLNVDALAIDAAYFEDPSAIAAGVAKDTLEQVFLQRLRQEKNIPGSNTTGGRFMVEAEEDKKQLYKAMRIPYSGQAASNGVPQG